MRGCSGVAFDEGGEESGDGFGVFAVREVAGAFEEDALVGGGEETGLVFGALR
jgi:hypothetical protein